MTKSIARRPNSQNLLTQLINNQQLIKEVQSLDAQVVKKIIHHVGLEDSGEFLMLITSEQMQEVMDQDTWGSDKPGEDERLDAKRFSLWLEVLFEVSTEFAVSKVIEMDEELLTSALSQLIFVLDADELLLISQSSENEYSGNNYLEKALESTFSMECEGFSVLSKSNNEWDAVSSLLTGLERDHRDVIERVLGRLAQVTLSEIEEFDGFYNLLKENEVLDNDVSSEREDRREKEGYVAPSAAKAFLKLAAQTTLENLASDKEPDHISKMYFRNFKPTKVRNPGTISGDLLKILDLHGVDVAAPQLKKIGSAARVSATQNYLTSLSQSHEGEFKSKLGELNFVANVLLSGYISDKEKLRPVEAMELAMQLCDQGLAYAKLHSLSVGEGDIIKLFKIGWKIRPLAFDIA